MDREYMLTVIGIVVFSLMIIAAVLWHNNQWIQVCREKTTTGVEFNQCMYRR